MQAISPRLVASACAVPIILVVWRLCGIYLNRYFTRKTTVLYELEDIGNARADEKRIQGTAVICGGRRVYSFYAFLRLLQLFVFAFTALLACGRRGLLLIILKTSLSLSLRHG